MNNVRIYITYNVCNVAFVGITEWLQKKSTNQIIKKMPR